MSASIWELLGVPPGSDRKAIRRGYAARLKDVNPEDDPEGFKALREAFEMAQWQSDAGYYDDFSDEPAEADAAADGAPPPDGWDAPIWPDALAPDRGSDVETEAFDAEPGFGAIHQDLDDRLRLLLDALDRDDPVDPDTLIGLLDDVLGSPAMDEIAVHGRVEPLLAYHLAGSIPRSDPLLERVAGFFGWDADEIHAGRDWHVDQILSRLRDRLQIRSLTFHDHPLKRGWRALTERTVSALAMRWDGLSPDVRAQVRELFDVARYDLPGLADEFVAERAEWWRAFLAKPRLSADAWLSVPFSAFLIYLLLEAWGDGQAGPNAGAISIFAALALPLLHLFTVKRLRHARLAETKAWPEWFVQGWMPASVALPFIVASIPATKIGIVLSGVLAACLFVWVSLAIPPRPPAGGLGRRIGAALSLLWPLGLVALFATPRLGSGETLQWAMVSAALAFIWVRAYVPIVYTIDRLVPRWPTAVALGLSIGLVALAAAIGQVLPNRTAVAAALALVAGWILLQGFWGNDPEKNKFLLVLGWLALIGHVVVAAPWPDSPGSPTVTADGGQSPVRGAIVITPNAGAYQKARCGPDIPFTGAARPPVPCAPNLWLLAEDDIARASPGSPFRTVSNLTIAVSSDGGVTDCAAAGPEEVAERIETACDAVLVNARFLPAVDARGRRAEGLVDAKVEWSAPEGKLPPPPAPPPSLAKSPGLNQPLDARKPFGGGQVKCPAEPKRGTGPLPLRPCGTFTDWMSLSDYPVAARSGEYGETRVVLLVSDKGKPTTCRVRKSSGSKPLDDTTCRVLKRGRWLPARDEEGRAVGTELTFTMDW